MSDTVEVRTTVSFHTLDVPTEVRIDLGEEGSSPLPLSELDDDVVDALVRRWLDNLYASRNQDAPFTYRPRVADAA